jgi:hypothetical protein
MSTIKKFQNNTQKGAAMLISVVFFLIISITIVVGIATPIIKQVKASTELVKAKETYYLAEGAIEDGLYRLRNNKALATGDVVSIAGSSATITYTTTSSGRVITATANVGGRIRKREIQVTAGSGASFNYGIQTGNGGFTLSGGSRINGNVYANGNIVASGGVVITGSAIAANSASLVTDQVNSSPTTPTNNVNFGNAAATQDIAQSFQVSTSSPLNYVQMYIRKVSTPGNLTVRIVNDNAGSPGTSVLDTATLGDSSGANAVTTTYGWVNATFTSNVVLTPGQTYWLVLDGGTNSSRYYTIGANTGYTDGTGKIGQYSSTWNNTSPSGLDFYFKMYLGGIQSSIGGGSYVGAVTIGSGGVGDAWANRVTGASVAGSLYCQTGSNNNKACNTSRPDPSPQGMPLSDANIEGFKAEAEPGTPGGTYNGNVSIGYAGTTTTSLRTINGNLNVNGGGIADMGELVVNGNVTISGGGQLKVGPMKVNGDLTIGSTGMTIKGTIYVTGRIIVNSGSTVRLDASYGANSGVIISDGILSLTGGGNFYGSGQAASYPLIVTTSDCPVGPTCAGSNAIEFSGGAGAVVLNAQKGTLRMSGGTSAKGLVANEIIVDSGGTVTYDSGIANLNFSSGPSGGWEIIRWQEVQ